MAQFGRQFKLHADMANVKATKKILCATARNGFDFRWEAGKSVTLYETCFTYNEWDSGSGGEFNMRHEEIFDQESYLSMTLKSDTHGGLSGLSWDLDCKYLDNYKTAKDKVIELWLSLDYQGYISKEGCVIRRKLIETKRKNAYEAVQFAIEFNGLDMISSVITLIVDYLFLNSNNLMPKDP